MSRPKGSKNKKVEAPAKPLEEAPNSNNCEYYLIMQFNNETLDCWTNNLKISMQSFGRDVLTEMYITIRKGNSEYLKRLTLVQGKKLFNDEQSLDIFLDTFYGLYGQPSYGTNR